MTDLTRWEVCWDLIILKRTVALLIFYRSARMVKLRISAESKQIVRAGLTENVSTAPGNAPKKVIRKPYCWYCDIVHLFGELNCLHSLLNSVLNACTWLLSVVMRTFSLLPVTACLVQLNDPFISNFPSIIANLWCMKNEEPWFCRTWMPKI